MSQYPIMGGCGAPGAVNDADKSIQDICDKVKPQAEQMARKNFDVFKAKSYRAQVVAGTNYFIKVHVGGNEYVHLSVFAALACNGGAVMLKDMQKSMSRDDPVQCF